MDARPDPDRRPGQMRQIRRPMEEWTTIHHGVYPAYITWEQFLANQARLADNASDFARRAHGAPRQGYALLAGLVVCGRCGYQMRVTYKPQRRYTCTASLPVMVRQPACMSMVPAWKQSLLMPFSQHWPQPNSICWKRCWLPSEQTSLDWQNCVLTSWHEQSMRQGSPSGTIRPSIPTIGSWQPSSNDAGKSRCKRWSKRERRWNAWLRILRSLN